MVNRDAKIKLTQKIKYNKLPTTHNNKSSFVNKYTVIIRLFKVGFMIVVLVQVFAAVLGSDKGRARAVAKDEACYEEVSIKDFYFHLPYYSHLTFLNFYLNYLYGLL